MSDRVCYRWLAVTADSDGRRQECWWSYDGEYWTRGAPPLPYLERARVRRKRRGYR